MIQKNRAYALVAVSALMLLLAGIHQGGFQTAVILAAAEFGLGQTGMGILIAVQGSSIILAPLLSGFLADRFGKKPLLAAGAAAVLLGAAVAGVSHRMIPFVAGVFLVGCGSSVAEAVSSAAIADCCPGQSNRLINLCQFFYSAGAITGPILVQGLVDLMLPWRLLYGLLGVTFLALGWPLLRLRLPRLAAPRRERAGSPFTFLRSPAYAMLFISIVGYVGLENGFGYFAGSLFTLGLSAPHLSAYAVSAFWAGTAAARLIGSFWSLPARKCVVVHYTLAAALLLVMALCPVAGVSLAVSFLVGLAYGPIWSALVAMAAGEFPERSAGAVGLMSTGCGIGGALFPAVMGAMADHLEIRAPFVLLSITALLCALLGLCYLRRKGRQT